MQEGEQVSPTVANVLPILLLLLLTYLPPLVDPEFFQLVANLPRKLSLSHPASRISQITLGI